jgi:hypothetical protein
VRKNFYPAQDRPEGWDEREAEERAVLGETSRRFFAEQWLLTVGYLDPNYTPQIFDTLLAYGYIEKAVRNVTIELNRDEENEGRNPVLTYQVHLRPWKAFQYRLTRLSGVLGKLVALAAVLIGAPIGLPERISTRAREYLPGHYGVIVEVR